MSLQNLQKKMNKTTYLNSQNAGICNLRSKCFINMFKFLAEEQNYKVKIEQVNDLRPRRKNKKIQEQMYLLH